MALDIIIACMVLLLGWFGSQAGSASQVFQLIIYGGGAYGAKLIATPSARFLITGIEWPLRFAMGMCYLLAFGLAVMVLWFVLGTQKDRVSAHSGGVDSALGGVMGAAGGIIVCYALLCGLILVSQHLGGERAMFAFQFQNSRAGRYVLTHSFVDPEPFPHAIVLQAVVGDPDPGFESQNDFAIGDVYESPKAQFLLDSPDIVAAIKAGKWKQVAKDDRVLALITDARFLAGARLYMTPVHTVKPEAPQERYKELR